MREPYQQPRLSHPARVTRGLQPLREGRAGWSASLCENSSINRFAEKAVLTFSLWRIFIVGEGDSDHFFAP
jgi:hypothetical protein